MSLRPTINSLLFCLALPFVLPISAFTQNTASPFDIVTRIEQSPEDSIIGIAVSSNPFDLVKTSPNSRPGNNDQRGFVVVKKDRPLTAKEKTSIYQRFLFIVVLTMMVILTLVVTIFRIFIGKIWGGFLNDNLLSQLMREQSTGVTVAYMILYLMFFINAGIFLFLACKHFGVEIAPTSFGALLACIGGIAGFYAIKHLLLRVVRFVFPIEKEIASYNFTIIVFNIIIGFFLVPMILLIAYAPDSVTKISIYATLALTLGAILFRNLRGLFIANRFFVWHKFHFFLYLCAVEIGPLLVTIKLLGLH